MATFKRLTKVEKGEPKVEVNMDTIMYMQRFSDHTRIYFAVPYFFVGMLTMIVKETPDEIHQVPSAP
jgi:hypothetical protein